MEAGGGGSALTDGACRPVSPALQEDVVADQLDQFGHITPMRHVDRGWLSVESVVQLKLYANPVELWKKRQRRVSQVECSRATVICVCLLIG